MFENINPVNLYTMIAVAIYFLIIAVIIYKSTRKESNNEYVIGDRKVGLLGTMSSQIVSNTDGTGLTIFLMFGIIYGFGTIWLYVGIALSAIFLSFHAKKINELAQKGKYVTVSDMFKDRIGMRSVWLSNIIVVLLSVLATAGQLYISGELISAFFGIESVEFGIVLTALIVGGYLMIGGYLTVIKTDIFQWIAVFVVGVVALIFGDFSVVSNLYNDMIGKIDNTLLWGFLLWGMAWGYASPYTWQRLFSAKSKKVARDGTWMTIPFNLLFGFAMVIFALTMQKTNPNLETNNLVFEIYTNPSVLPIIGPFLGVTLLALLMSSLDTYGYMTSSTITTNMIGISHEKNKKRYIYTSRIITIAMFIITAIMAIFISDFIEYMMTTVSMFVLLVPVYIVVLFRNKKSRLLDQFVLGSFMIGAYIWIYMFFAKEFDKGFLYMLIPMIVSAVITMVFLPIYNKLYK